MTNAWLALGQGLQDIGNRAYAFAREKELQKAEQSRYEREQLNQMQQQNLENAWRNRVYQDQQRQREEDIKRQERQNRIDLDLARSERIWRRQDAESLEETRHENDMELERLRTQGDLQLAEQRGIDNRISGYAQMGRSGRGTGDVYSDPEFQQRLIEEYLSMYGQLPPADFWQQAGGGRVQRRRDPGTGYDVTPPVGMAGSGSRGGGPGPSPQPGSSVQMTPTDSARAGLTGGGPMSWQQQADSLRALGWRDDAIVQMISDGVAAEVVQSGRQPDPRYRR